MARPPMQERYSEEERSLPLDWDNEIIGRIGIHCLDIMTGASSRIKTEKILSWIA